MLRILRLDPSLPVVWRTPWSFQVGVNPAQAIVDHVDARLLPVLTALQTGISEEGYKAIASNEGLTDEAGQEFLDTLSNALLQRKQEKLPGICVTGSTGHSEIFARVWRQLGYPLSNVTPAQPESEAFLLANFVLPPRAYHPWLSLDLPHTPVIFADQAIVIGPRVTPGLGPCLACVWDNQAHREPALVALSSQLSTRQAASATEDLHALAAWHARELLLAATPGLVFRIDRYTRTSSAKTEKISAECLCQRMS